MNTTLKRFKTLPILFLLAGCSATSEPGGNELAQIPPAMADRHADSLKADESAPVQRLYHAVATTPNTGRFIVNLATSGIDPVSVGIAYREYWGSYGSSNWKTFYGHYTGKTEDGRSSFTVEAPFEIYYQSVLYVRYAVFAVDNHSDKTYWDNNGGADFYYFRTENGDPVHGWMDLPAENAIRLDMQTTNLGYERVTVIASLDNWATSREIRATWTQGSGWDDSYTVEIPMQGDPIELSFKVRFEFEENGRYLADNGGHAYHIGLQQSQPAVIVFEPGGISTTGELRRGGYVQVQYNRTPQCTSSHYGFTWRVVELQYRFHDDRLFSRLDMQQSMRRPEDNNPECDTEWCPETMQSYHIYIPLNADELSVWFHHTGSYPECSAWDSNNGNDYHFDLQ